MVHPGLPEWVPPVIASVILLGLFLMQRHGTARIGQAFGPVMLLWFLTLAVTGLWHLGHETSVLRAFSPHYGWEYLWHERGHSMNIMGTVLLAVTGGEALYADIGHFGRVAMNRSWFTAVYPALALNYLGQGAMLLRLMHDPGVASEDLAQIAEQPFFKMVTPGMLPLLVVLTTCATIIASQAMITGVFSLSQQAVQLGFMPRLKIVHTSPDMRGQIYLPQINFVLMILCIGLVAGFKKSENLAHAYGLSVSLEMLITSAMLILVATKLWKWPAWRAVGLCGLFMIIETAYVLGGLSKLVQGAWFTLLIALGIYVIMRTWRDGRALLMERVKHNRAPDKVVVDELKAGRIHRVRGIGVFLSSSAEGLPLVLLHHLKHNKVLHEQAVILTVKFEEVPYIPDDKRIEITDLMDSFFRVVLHYGFSESPDVPRDFKAALASRGITRQADISFYQSRELLLTDGKGKMAQWRKKLFVFLSRLARPATGYFQLPSAAGHRAGDSAGAVKTQAMASGGEILKRTTSRCPVCHAACPAQCHKARRQSVSRPRRAWRTEDSPPASPAMRASTGSRRGRRKTATAPAAPAGRAVPRTAMPRARSGKTRRAAGRIPSRRSPPASR